MATIGVPPHRTAVISGIGCSSRLPYYCNTYGFHTIHGRAAAIATGFKVANPDMTVWQVSGDGDGLAIGGNHFIHCLRRNVDINILLLNNKIYGLTKGQYSPTSPRGFVSKSSPYGTTEDPFVPAELRLRRTSHLLCTQSRCRTPDHTGDHGAQPHAISGAAVVEVLQNCVIFNNGTHNWVSDKGKPAPTAPYTSWKVEKCCSAKILKKVSCRKASRSKP